MNHNEIVRFLNCQGFSASLEKYNESVCIDVNVSVSNSNFTLMHLPETEITELPKFYIRKTDHPGILSHVVEVGHSGVSLICVTSEDAVSVNFEQPHLAISHSLTKHIDLLTQAVLDENWNEQELLREFSSTWTYICDSSLKEFICASENGELEPMEVLCPIPDAKIGIGSHYLGLSRSSKQLPDFSYINLQAKSPKRRAAGTGIIFPLNKLDPAPTSISQIKTWYLNAISKSTVTETEIFSRCAKSKSKNYWIVFNATTPSGIAWFGIRFQSNEKKFLPTQKTALSSWDVKPFRVRVFNKDRILPRGGADISLADKKVLLIGCGSVGGEIATKLGSSGVGELCLVDDDEFKIDNLYRHVLSDSFLGAQKSLALSIELQRKFPWLVANYSTERLLDFRDIERLRHFDLIVIAIGSPTHERIFSKYFHQNEDLPPMLNTWVEGYGIGGHATIDIPSSSGCMDCAYVDPNDFSRGLASNLNFFEANQNLTTNHAGCGDLFLPYSRLNASQTATIATDLAVNFLTKKINNSSKVSWRGDDTDALAAGFTLTHRYYNFKDTMKILPLHHEGCDICA